MDIPYYVRATPQGEIDIDFGSIRQRVEQEIEEMCRRIAETPSWTQPTGGNQ